MRLLEIVVVSTVNVLSSPASSILVPVAIGPVSAYFSDCPFNAFGSSCAGCAKVTLRPGNFGGYTVSFWDQRLVPGRHFAC